jgi:putative transposase
MIHKAHSTNLLNALFIWVNPVLAGFEYHVILIPEKTWCNKHIMQHKSHYHCVYNLKYHLVLVTKYRRKCFTSEMLTRLEEICKDLCQKWEVGLNEFDGETDHVHLLLDMHPNIMPSKFINNLKTVTSRLMRKEFATHLGKLYSKPVLWTRAYCLISADGAPLSVLKDYIKKQERPE